MPRKITNREKGAWEHVADDTLAMDVVGPDGIAGVLVQTTDTSPINGETLTSALVFVPGTSIAVAWPWRETEVCADGDPFCGDDDCERKHATPPSSAEDGPRFWIDDTPTLALPPGWVAIVDEQAGGIIAAAQSEGAAVLLQLLRLAAAGER